jgi:hypothetical protein
MALAEPETAPSASVSHGTDRSLNISHRIERRLARLETSGSVYRRWALEFISLGISAFCMAPIIAALIFIQDKPPWKWPFGNIQTFITALAKVAAAALIIPTSEAIGQLKWNWFNGKFSKEIYDFEIFDQPSRGPWGSFMLLILTKGRSLASLGAVLTLLMLGIDTFFQQVVSIPQRWEFDSPVRLRSVTHYEARSAPFSRGGLMQFDVDEDMSTVVEKFLFDNGTQLNSWGNGTQAIFPVICPTGNCTWPEHQTLAVCSACEDVSEMLTFACLSSRIDWLSNVTDTEQTTARESTIRNGTMCGYYINATSPFPVLMSGYSVNQSSEEALLMRTLPSVTYGGRFAAFGGSSLNFRNIRYPLIDFIVSSTIGGFEGVHQNETPVAHECILYWCVKNLEASSYEGNYKETTLSTFTNTTGFADLWVLQPTYESALGPVIMVSFSENVTVNTPLEDGGSEYGLSNGTNCQTIGTLDTFLPSFTTAQNATAEPVMRHGLRMTVPTTRVLPVNPWLRPKDISGHMERMAMAMTNVMRATASDSRANGTAWAVETYIQVSWGWITYPFVLLVLSFVFLIATIRKSSQVKNEIGAWKTSTMPTLLYGLPRTTRDSLGSNSPAWTKPGRQGHSTRIKLLPNKGWRISGCTSAPTTPVSDRDQAWHG